MKMTFDKEADAAYIYVKDEIKKGEVKKTISLNEDIIIDFDKDEKLIGVEILNASHVLSKNVLDKQLAH